MQSSVVLMAATRCKSLPRGSCGRVAPTVLSHIRYQQLRCKDDRIAPIQVVQQNSSRIFATASHCKSPSALLLRRYDKRSFSCFSESSQRQQFRPTEDTINGSHEHNQPQKRGWSQKTTTQNDSSMLQELGATPEPAHNPISFREIMRLVTHPVAVITSTDTKVDEQGGPISWRGATVSSFNSVTLDPEPYVSFNVKKLSSTYDAICSSNMFAAHLLSETLQATEMATQFSRGNEVGPFFVRNADGPGNKGQVLQPWVSRSSGGKAWKDYAGDIAHNCLPPSLQWTSHSAIDAVLFRILCQYQPEKTISVGDHVVVIGKVIQFVARDLRHTHSNESSFESPAGLNCLTYSNGNYNLESAG